MIPSSKEKILNSIRKALADEPKVGNAPVALPLYHRTESDAILEFIENFSALGCEFIFSTNDSIEEDLGLYLAERNYKHICAWESHVVDFLNSAQIPVITNDSNFAQVQASITSCEALVARTGSIVVTSNKNSSRRLSIYPPHHIVLAATSQIVSDIKDALQFIQRRFPKDTPSMISFISGASRTADIEKTLVKGAHGPKELTLFLVHDLDNE